MVVENEITSFLGWLLPSAGPNASPGALVLFLLIVAILAVLGLVGGYLVSLVRHGPLKAGDLVYRTLAASVQEATHLSLRRVMALAGLSIKEALRRRVLVALGVFVIVLVFAAWFLKNDYRDPVGLYLSVVFNATTFLTLVVAPVLSTFSLPGDFKSKTIYTIVTKPVRPAEIVLGRIIGFAAIGTLLMAIMGTLGYVFVVRALDHTHEVELATLSNVTDASGETVGKQGQTSVDLFHRHDVVIDADGQGEALSANGHTHRITQEGDRYVVSGPEGLIQARVPKRGEITFLDRQGVAKSKGISVGKEWAYRSYIDGGTKAAAIWTFDNVTPALLIEDESGAQALPIELLVRVFRSFKGDVNRGILGSIRLRNPDNPDLQSEEITFTAKDFSIERYDVPRAQFAQVDGQRKAVDLIDDLTSKDGRLEVVVQCLEGGHYFGFARADMFIRRPDASPLMNYVKATIIAWVQMVIVVSIGVAASTLLSGPIALLFTVAFLVLGYNREYFFQIATEQSYGGGPIESLVRLVTQKNVMTPFDPSPQVALMQRIDDGLEGLMWAVAQMVPDLPALSAQSYVSEGFDIPWAMVGRAVALMLAYVVGLSAAGYFFFRTREVAR